MTLGETDFLKILTRVIQLHKECRLYANPYYKFSYDLSEVTGVLHLLISFPHMGDAVTVTYNGKQCDAVYNKLQDVEEYLASKRVGR